MNVDLERYRFAVDSIHGITTVAILCATCHEAGGDNETVIVFDFQFPSLGDAQTAIQQHETQRHAA